MRKYGILLIICIFQILLSCTKVPVGPSLKDILSANSKLQVVLDKYKDDSLKYKSAVFLIENLPFHYSYEGEPLDDYLKLFELHGKGTMYPDKVLDSIKRACGPFHMDKLEAKSDIYIDPVYLIENIEWAFKVWREQPWGKTSLLTISVSLSFLTVWVMKGWNPGVKESIINITHCWTVFEDFRKLKIRSMFLKY
ncbi:MAG: hypothetical protein ACLUE2_14900 [Bacteroides cellulosilyticus]